MIIERDAGIVIDDGAVLRADVFRPAGPEPVPVVMTLGPPTPFKSRSGPPVSSCPPGFASR